MIKITHGLVENVKELLNRIIDIPMATSVHIHIIAKRNQTTCVEGKKNVHLTILFFK